MDTNNYKIMPNIVYFRKCSLELTFDMYQPRSNNGAAVIFINSGGWASWFPDFFKETTTGCRLLTDEELSTLNPLLPGFSFRPLLAEGFTVFAVRHESTPTSKMPGIVADLRRAVRFIRFHAEDYGVDTGRIGLWGPSAGGHLALLLGTTMGIGIANATDEWERAAGHVAAVVAYFAPSDLRRFVNADTTDDLDLLPALSLQEEGYKQFSPIYFASSEAAPTLIVHGAQDRSVPIIEGESMFHALQKEGVPSKLVTIEDARHCFYGDEVELAMKETVIWFKKYLSNESH